MSAMKGLEELFIQVRLYSCLSRCLPYLQNNMLRLLPGSLASMELYNFNVYNNPLLGSIDELETGVCCDAPTRNSK